jgi:secreted trypsin-like serine protease
MMPQYNRLFSHMRIVGGKPAELGQFPHQISFQLRNGGWIHYCGGSILTNDLIVTAAHCLESGLPISQARVVAGIIDAQDESTGQIRGVSRAEQHPDFDMFFNIVNDIAFLRLDEPLEFNDNVKPIQVAAPGDEPSRGDRACTASGWGNEDIGQPTSRYLQFVNINYIEDSDCVSQWSGAANVFPEQNVCAGTDAGGESVCQGDSGGPLICQVEGDDSGNYVLFGATSWGSGRKCGERGKPAVWAEVPYFLDWLETTSGVDIP